MRSSISTVSATFWLDPITARVAELRSLLGLVATAVGWAREAVFGLVAASKFRELVVRTLSRALAIRLDAVISDGLEVPAHSGRMRPFHALGASETSSRLYILRHKELQQVCDVGDHRPEPAEFRPRASNFAGSTVS